MKNSIIIIFLCSFFFACKKDIPEPDVIKMDVFATKVKFANHNEPDILYWYVRKANKGGYFYLATTTDVKNFTEYTFHYSKEIPNELSGKSPLRQIVVWLNQLNGDLLFDITGKSVSIPAAE